MSAELDAERELADILACAGHHAPRCSSRLRPGHVHRDPCNCGWEEAKALWRERRVEARS
jgi:hypothetical protein